jgi:hypothetical protein
MDSVGYANGEFLTKAPTHHLNSCAAEQPEQVASKKWSCGGIPIDTQSIGAIAQRYIAEQVQEQAHRP